MSDDKSNRGLADGQRINVNEVYELAYWAQRFKTDRDAIRSAVVKVGPIVRNVERELAKGRPSRSPNPER